MNANALDKKKWTMKSASHGPSQATLEIMVMLLSHARGRVHTWNRVMMPVTIIDA
jgi:hypothetical protein